MNEKNERTITINVQLANRNYRLQVMLNEEFYVREAVKSINNKLSEMEQYAVKDKQDVIAMAAITIATQYEKLKDNIQQENNQLLQQSHSILQQFT